MKCRHKRTVPCFEHLPGCEYLYCEDCRMEVLP